MKTSSQDLLAQRFLVSNGKIYFLNFLIQKMTDMFQLDHRKTNIYHPHTNGQNERVNETFVSIIFKAIMDSKRDWDVKLTALWSMTISVKINPC
jgi:hypothetical protein